MPGLRHFALLIALFAGAFVPPATAEAAQPPPSSEMVDLEMVALEIEGLGGEIEWLDVTAAEHPFWVRDEGWIEAGDLLPGDELFTSAGGWARVSGATWAEVEAAVYNLDVEGWDSYFVGEGGYWVHNADCPQGLAPGGAERAPGLSGVPRSGSALKADPHHAFLDLVDNFAGDATRFEIPTRGPGGQVVRTSELLQVEGSLNGRGGVFEWIVDQGAMTHRRFIPGGTVTGFPNQVPGR